MIINSKIFNAIFSTFWLIFLNNFSDAGLLCAPEYFEQQAVAAINKACSEERSLKILADLESISTADGKIGAQFVGKTFPGNKFASKGPLSESGTIALLERAQSSTGTQIIPNLDTDFEFWIREDGKYYEVWIENPGPKYRVMRITDTPPTVNETFRRSLFAATREKVLDLTPARIEYREMLSKARNLATPLPSLPESLLENNGLGNGLPSRSKVIELAQKEHLFYFIPMEEPWALSPVPYGKRSGYKDISGNIWTKGPSRTAGEAFEWDVQLSPNAPTWMRTPPVSRSGKHINVSLTGKITH